MAQTSFFKIRAFFSSTCYHNKKLETIFTQLNQRNVHFDRCDVAIIVTPWVKYAIQGLHQAQFCKEGKRVLCLQNLCIFRIRSSMKMSRTHQRRRF